MSDNDWNTPAEATVKVRCISVDRPHVPHVHTDGEGKTHNITRGLKHSEEVDLPTTIAAVLLKNRHAELVA